MPSPLNTPFKSDPFASKTPSPTECSNGTLRSGVSQLDMPEDTEVLKTVFYQDADSLKWKNEALSSPMGTGIVNPNSMPKKV